MRSPEQDLEKSVDAAKSIYHLLVAATVTLLLFGTAPEKLDVYHRAEAQLSALVAFDQRAYFDFLSQQSSEFHVPDDARRSLVGLGLPADAIRVPLYCEMPDVSTSIREWLKFANDRRLTVRAFVPRNTSAAVDALRMARREVLHIENAYVADGDHLDEYDEFVRGQRQTSCLPLRPGGLSKPVLVVAGSTRGTSPTISIPIKVDGRGIESNLFQRWAAPKWPHREVAQGVTFLLADAASIGETYDKTAAQALVAVQDKLATAGGQLAVLGISIPVDLAAWLGPLVVLVLMAYMHTHVKHVQRVAMVAGTARDSASWIAVFPDAISRILTVVSVLIAPVAAELLVLRHATMSPPTIRLGQSVVVLSTAGVSIASLVAIFQVTRSKSRD